MVRARMAPGHYPELTNDAYHESEGVSNSHLYTIGEKSPAHYFDKYLADDREPHAKTDDMVLGDAMHKAILEPDLLASEFVVWEGPPRNTIEGKAAWKEFQPTALGKTVLTKAGMKAVRGVRDSVWRHPVAKELLKRGKAEQTYYSIDPVTGEVIKCRVDYDRIASDGLMVDLKSTKDANEEPFRRSCETYNYYMQGGFYPYVVDQLWKGAVQSFAFLAFEKVRPYAIGIYYLEDLEAQIGMMDARRNLNLISRCRQTNRWPDYGYTPKPVRMSSWHRRTVENRDPA